MTIEVTYNVTDVYISSEVSPIYIDVNYTTSGSGAAVWGSITGTLSDQTDLQTALNAKFDDPTGTTSQYIRGDGTLATFPALTGYVPYTGATTNVNLGEYEIKAGQVTLDTSPTGTAAVGTTRWNDTIGSAETTLKGGTVVLKNGVDLVARIVNKVTPNTTLTKAAYQAVRVSGAQGQRLAVAFAQANNDNNSADTIGLVTETIATNQEGFIITVGQIEGINTTGSLQGETWADGDVLYLSPTIAGALTNVKPTGATGHIVIIGYVEYAHANNGKIYVKVMNGWELDELHNVSITSVANNQGLFYNSTSSLWENKSISTILGYTPEQPLTFSSPLSRATNAVSISAATSSVNGYLSSTDWSTFNGKENALTFSSPLSRSTNTISIPLATSSVSGYLSSTDWSTFNGKQGALTLTTTGTSGAATLVGTTLNIPQYSGGGGMAIGGSITSATAGSVLFAGTSGVLAQNNANFFWDNTNKRLGIGTNAPVAQLNVNQVAGTTKGIFISGDEIYATGNGTADKGVRIAVGVNRLGNRQLWIGDSDAFGSATLSLFRYQTGTAGYAGIDVVSGDGVNRLLTVLGTDTSNVGIGINSDTVVNTALYTSKLNVFTYNSSNSNLLLRKFGTATGNYLDVVNTSGTTIAFLSNSGNLNIGTGSTDAGYRLDVNGTARVQSKLSLSAGTTLNAQINLASSTAPTSPNNGDLWFDGVDLKMRIGGVTKTFTLV